MLFTALFLAVALPLIRAHMGMSILEMAVYTSVASAAAMFCLLCGVLFRKRLIDSNDPLKQLVAITLVLYGGLVLGVGYGVLLYWVCSDLHHFRWGS